ncbi:hypothetical protein SSX86_017643 [Deinandra increscens subsp. villosa]|uniref:Uncharacterized protein n=1 Tax=Deinandra increscens subsp. villosa TaxID=3103831 RepID=A0AAP0CX98_9ASTR
MKNRGKSVKSEQDKANLHSDSTYYSSSSGISCRKHPSISSSGGICAYCLNEKLIRLVCSDCGEQRISSCSCSGLSSYRNSSCTLDVGSVGRISFLIENEKISNGDDQKTLFSHLQLKQSETEDSVLLKRSNSCVVEVKKSNGIWGIGKLFKKKREKEGGSSERNRSTDVSRSRSQHEMCSVACSSAKISNFDNESERRKSGLVDFEGGFPVKEADFSIMDDDDDEFIDLKIDLCDKSKTEYSVSKKQDLIDGGGGGMGSSSCRIMVDDRGIKKKGLRGGKWIYKHHSGNDDHNHILKS